MRIEAPIPSKYARSITKKFGVTLNWFKQSNLSDFGGKHVEILATKLMEGRYEIAKQEL